jgi:2-haloalkanoic acid dehalogenase type II
MARRYDLVTFDCYGTLVDWDAGIAGALTPLLAAGGAAPAPADVLAAYHAAEPEVEAEAFRPYREVLTATAVRAAARLGRTLSAAQADAFAASLPEWPPFPDTNPALERLAAAGYRLGILSNVDDDLLAGTLRHLTVPFALLVTAQQVRSYKPAPGHFLAARERVGDARWLHAAQSLFHDVAPATALGIPVVWINRKGEPAPREPRPDRAFPDLAGLAAWLA